MYLKPSLLYAKKIIFSKNRKGEKNTGRKSLIGACVCTCISIIPLIVVLCVSTSMINGMTERLIGLSSGHLQVKFSARSSNVSSYEDFLYASDYLQNKFSDKTFYPEVQGSVLAAGRTGRSGGVIRALPIDVFKSNEYFLKFFNVVDGSVELENLNSCIIGQKLASDLDLKVGDTLRTISVLNMGSSGKMIPKYNSFKINGIVSSGYQELDALWIFIPLEKAYDVFNANNAQYVISVFFNEQDTYKAYSAELKKIQHVMQDYIIGFEEDKVFNSPIDSAYVYTWDEVNESRFESFASSKLLLILVMSLIVLVADFNISAAIIMIVIERKKEIAILKSTGSTTGQISFAFVCVGLFCGITGIAVGVPVSLICSLNINSIIHFIEIIANFFKRSFYLIQNHTIMGFTEFELLDPGYYLQDISVVIPVKEILVIVVCTLLLSVIVSLIPAIKGGKEKPIETLRKM